MQLFKKKRGEEWSFLRLARSPHSQQHHSLSQARPKQWAKGLQQAVAWSHHWRHRSSSHTDYFKLTVLVFQNHSFNSFTLMKLLSVAWFLLAASQVVASNVSAVIFQGFDYSWERKILGFETPHRLGSVAAFVDNSSLFVCRFTPGVDGDFAHPRLLYAVLSKEAPISSLSGHWHSVVHDFAEKSDHPFAETKVQERIVIKPQASVSGESGGGFDNAVVLNGFNVSMLCNSSCGICNSNGAWVYSFNMSISNCTNDGALECEISLGLGRGWTPTHGGGKSFNLCA